MGSVGKNAMTLVGERVFFLPNGGGENWTNIAYLEPTVGSWDISELKTLADGNTVMDSSITAADGGTGQPTFNNVAVIGASAARESPPAPSVERLLIAVGPPRRCARRWVLSVPRHALLRRRSGRL